MIGKLRGLIDSIHEGYLILDVNAVGYVVFGSSRMLQQLPELQSEISLVIETHVREDHIHLYGFINDAERDWFRLLTTVQGVGAKVALSIQSSFLADELTTIISAEDKTSLTRVNGVGKKVSERIITELKSKVAAMIKGTAVDIGLSENSGSIKATFVSATGNSIREEATSALVNLGYVRVDAFSAVARVLANAPEASLSDAIRLGLKELG